jgi:GTPase
LVQAFHATLEEVANADLLLHIVDAAAHDRDDQIENVNDVLAEIGAQEIPQIVVFNKIDLFSGAQSSGIERRLDGAISRVNVSAQERQGLDSLRLALKEALEAPTLSLTVGEAEDGLNDGDGPVLS